MPSEGQRGKPGAASCLTLARPIAHTLWTPVGARSPGGVGARPCEYLEAGDPGVAIESPGAIENTGVDEPADTVDY